MNTTNTHYDFQLVTIESVPKLRVDLKVSKERMKEARETPKKQ